jgi:acetolactate synthase-1/2/3 large subunit
MLKPTELKNVPAGLLERAPNAGEFIAQALNQEGVEYIFGVHGGHEWPWLDPIVESGIKQVTVRHEQTAGYAAEAYARVGGKIGVCNVTVGPGGTNIFTSVHQAFLSKTPMLVLCAGHESSHDGLGTLQESYTEKYFTNVTKITKRIVHNSLYKYWVRRGICEAMTSPRGPVVLDFELEAILGRANPPQFYNSDWGPLKSEVADPDDIAKIVKLIYEAKRPCILAGDGIMWGRAARELVEFCELAGVPAMGRRGGRGAIPEDHPLSFKSPGVINQSDLLIMLGAQLDFYDQWGARWKISRVIEVNDYYQGFNTWLPTALAVKADVGAVMRQMLVYAKQNGLRPPDDRAEWIAKVREQEQKRWEYLRNNAERFKERKPIHGLYLAKVINETLTDLYKNDVLYCGDSFTGWNLASPYMVAKTAGGVFDGGQQAGVGHGVGQAIGGALGTNCKKVVFAMMGDAGIGNGGMDIETAVRWKLPVVFCVYNNDLWGADCEKFYGRNMEFFPPEVRDPMPNFFLKDIRYDKLSEVFGCHGEWVTSPEELRPSLERACKSAESGKPAVVNVDVSDEPIQAIMDSPIVNLMFSHLPWNKLTNIHKKMRAKHLYFMFKEALDQLGAEPEEYDRYERTPDDFDING